MPPPSKRSKKDWASDFKEVADHTLSNITQDFLECPGTSGSNVRLISSTPTVNNAHNEKQDYCSTKTIQTKTESHKSTSSTIREPFSKTLSKKPFSSRKRPVDEILSTSAHLQGPHSLFADNEEKASTSRHGVEFNISALKNYSSAKKFKPINNDSTLRSPFYPGRTMYGGASAYSRIPDRLTSFAEVKKPIRSSIQIQPVNPAKANQSNTMSQTARRIMEALDQFTAKLPTVEYTSPNKPALVQTRKRFGAEERLLNQTLGISQRAASSKPYSRLSGNKFNRSFNCELQVATVPDLLKMKKRERLQESTKSVRELAKNSNSDLNKPVSEYTLRTENDEKANNQTKQTTKLKNKISKTRPGKSASLEEESVPVLNLPSVQLSITSLPKFDIITQPPPPPPVLSSSNIVPSQNKFTDVNLTLANTIKSPVVPNSVAFTEKSSTPKADTRIVNNYSAPTEIATFKFAPPIKVCEGNNITAAVNNFKFSVPLKAAMDKKLEMKFDPTNVKLKKKPVLDNSISKSPGIPVANELKRGSVMDILKSPASKTVNNNLDAFKSSKSATWECQTCLVRNKIDAEKCVACETKKTNKSEPNVTNQFSFGDKFKLSTDKWECQACMVRNEAKAVSCVACTTPKAGPVKPNEPTLQQNVTPFSGFAGFGDKFKQPSDSWTCDVCMIKNKSIDNKCVACETLKPGAKTSATTMASSTILKPSTDSGFMDLIKKQNSKWECSGCMTRNDDNRAKCACCEAPKPGSLPETAQFSFGVVAPTEFKFGIDKADTSQTNSKGSIFGKVDTKIEGSSNVFSFGIPADKREKEKKENSTILTKPQSAASFTFGIPQQTEVAKTVLPQKSAENSIELDDQKIKTDKKNSVTSTTGFSLLSKATNPTPVFGATFTEKTTPAQSIAQMSNTMKTAENIVSKPIVTLSDSSSSKSIKSPDLSTSKLANSTTSAGSLFTFGSSNTATGTAVSSNLVTSSTSSLPSYQPTKPTSSSMFTFTSVNNTENKLKLGNSKLENNTTLNKSGYDGFGSVVSAAEPPKPALPGFGSSGGFGALKQTEQKNPGFQFGATQNKSFGFNSNKETTSSLAPKTDLFSFGAKSDENKGSSAPFSFTASTPAAVTPGFGFGTLNKSATLNTQPSMFGAQNASTPAINFNAQPVQSPATIATLTPTFGTPAATPSFGAPANSAFGNPTVPAFGGSSNPTSAFQFGATGVNQNPAVFAFGTNRGSDPQPAASGAFSFGSNSSNVLQPTAAVQQVPNAFNPDVAPGFNFNMGANPMSFTAPPATGGAAAGRKIKRAVRRAPPR